MEGIVILDTIHIYQLAWWQIILMLLPLIGSAIIFFIRLNKAIKKGTPEEQARGVVSSNNWSPNEFLITLSGGVLSIILGLLISINCPAQFIETQYEIKIEDSVSFNDFYNSYIILEEKENTFVVKERKEN